MSDATPPADPSPEAPDARLEVIRRALEERYDVQRLIGEGGMARVYLALDRKHDRPVALKVLRPELAAVIGAERFLTEIRTTAQLQHPHVLPLFDSGQADNLLYYSMPYIEGESLRTRIEREHQLPVDEAVAITRALAGALSAAHERGIIHRDLKPANVLLNRSQPLLADFGISLAVGAASDNRLTETGLSLGTPHYMSPEQVTGEASIAAASDIYALGAVLYEMLVGDPPYAASTPQAVIGRMISEPAPSARGVRPTVPPNVDAAIRRALERVPADRFASAEVFSRALGNPDFRWGEMEAAPVGVRRRAVVAAGLAAGVAGLALGAFGLGPLLGVGSAGSEPIRFGAVTKVTFGEGLVVSPKISPDGREVAYTEVSVPRPTSYTPELPDSQRPRVVVRPISGGPPGRVTTEVVGDEFAPDWNPDGAALLIAAAGRIHSVPARGGVPRPVTRATPEAPAFWATWATWSPDGGEFAYGSDGALVARTTDGDERTIAELDFGDHQPAWSPDGRWIAFVRGNSLILWPGPTFGNVATSQILVVAAEGGEPIALTPPEGVALSPAWLPDGRLLFISNRGGGRDVFMLELERDGRPAGEPTRVTAGLAPISISISRDGGRLAYATLSVRQNIYRMPIPASGVLAADDATPVTMGNQLIEGMAISPDGDWVAFDSNRSGNQDVYRRRLAGGDAFQLTADPQLQFLNSWPAAGRWLTGHGFQGDVRDIVLYSEDGLDMVYPFPTPYQDRYPDLSPDGRRLVFESERPAPTPMIMDIDGDGRGTEPQPLAEGGMGVRWSPDGSAVAFVSRDFLELRVVEPGGSFRVVYRESDPDQRLEKVEWHAGGERLLFWRNSQAARSFWSVRTDGTGLREVVRFDDLSRTPRPEIAVHEEEVFFTLADFESEIWVVDLIR